MSELRWNWVYYPYLDAPNKQAESALKAGYVKVVDKDETDKVIAEKDAEIAQLQAMLEERNKQVGELKKACNDKDDWCLHTLKENRHHKYKRCLAMARWCGDAYDKWMMKKANAIALSKDGIKYYHQARWKVSHYMRWHKRWLELAEKFKEAK